MIVVPQIPKIQGGESLNFKKINHIIKRIEYGAEILSRIEFNQAEEEVEPIYKLNLLGRINFDFDVPSGAIFKTPGYSRQLPPFGGIDMKASQSYIKTVPRSIFGKLPLYNYPYYDGGAFGGPNGWSGDVVVGQLTLYFQNVKKNFNGNFGTIYLFHDGDKKALQIFNSNKAKDDCFNVYTKIRIN